MDPKTPPVTVDLVADLLATVAAANGLIAAEADRISNSRAVVSLATLERLATLTAELRPGAEARAVLAELDPDLLLAGTSVWLARRRSAAAGPSAAARAATRWGGPSWLEDRVGEGEVGA
ncbi:hypothetical protein [uncultured Jatrophihabitans sp.]|uniref:hypothetical protein n=1 Tax=uncultured Jatrophihabitans sp. TaxID=1610747 RepID=UPI0035CA8DF5